MTLIEQFEKRPYKGTLRVRLERAASRLKDHDGAPLLKCVDDITCHAAQLAIILEGLRVIRDYTRAMPPSGTASKLAIAAAEEASYALDPTHVTVSKLS